MIRHQEIGVIGERSIGMVLAILIIGMGLIPIASLRADPSRIEKVEKVEKVEKGGKLIACGENSHFDSERFRCVCNAGFGRDSEKNCVSLCREEDHKVLDEETGYCVCLPCFELDPDGFCAAVWCGQYSHCDAKNDRCVCDVGAFYDSIESVCVMKKMKKGK